jgi:hypothetical protein
MITTTYGGLIGDSEEMLLIEKYNIMKSYEREISLRDIDAFRRKYAIDVGTQENRLTPVRAVRAKGDEDTGLLAAYWRRSLVRRFLDWYLGK